MSSTNIRWNRAWYSLAVWALIACRAAQALLSDQAGAVDGQSGQVTAQQLRVAARRYRRNVTGDHLLDVAVEPSPPRRRRRAQRRLGEAALKHQVQVVADVDLLRGRSQRRHSLSDDAIEERRAADSSAQLAHRQAVHRNLQKTAGPRPDTILQLGADGAGEDEPARPRIVIDGPLDRAEDIRRFLPLVDDNRLRQPQQHCIGVGGDGGPHVRPVKAKHRPRTPHSRCGLAGRARAHEGDSAERHQHLV